MPDEKEFKTLDEQLSILRSYDLTIENEDKARKILEFDNYYCVVNGYKDLFLDTTAARGHDTYQNAVTLEQIWNLFLFDRSLRQVFLPSLLLIEHHAATTIAYEFSRQYGHRDSIYLQPCNFDPDPAKAGDVAETISQLRKDIKAHQNDECIFHYQNQYKYIPLWVLINVMSFGQLSKFYSDMKEQDRNSVARHFLIKDEVFGSFLNVLCLFRNQCAHDSRLYSYKTRRCIIRETVFHRLLSLQKDSHGRYTAGQNDLLAVLICIRLLCGQSATRDTVKKIGVLLLDLRDQLGTELVGNVILRMGLPTNWADVSEV
jgi:abortive infection bacteriophage resistance protein